MSKKDPSRCKPLCFVCVFDVITDDPTRHKDCQALTSRHSQAWVHIRGASMAPHMASSHVVSTRLLGELLEWPGLTMGSVYFFQLAGNHEGFDHCPVIVCRILSGVPCFPVGSHGSKIQDLQM